MVNDIADFMGRKPSICGHREIMKPKFGLFVAAAHMNMRRLVTFVGIEERAIGTPAKNRWHVFPLIRAALGSIRITLPQQCFRYTGKLSCLRPGISTVLPRRSASARARRGRVA